MTVYNPKIVLWQMCPQLLKAYFESKGYPFDIVWGKMDETQIQKIHNAFLKLPDSAQQNIETDLQDIHTIASTEIGISILIKQAIFYASEK
jgi:2-oxo-4-hydroxy-4-carboxy--5-ureidoimidazoline (OHCU) decarboxylase